MSSSSKPDLDSHDLTLEAAMTTYMVVEDEPDLYEMLTAMSTVLGVDEVAFATGEEAVTWIEEVDAGLFQGNLPILALLDIRLPGEIDGVMVAERLRISGALKQIAVVLMTAYHLTPEQEQSYKQRAGADLLIYKPLPSLPELRDLLHNVAQARLKAQMTTKRWRRRGNR
jgi:CheY-like chemotaxis protein